MGIRFSNLGFRAYSMMNIVRVIGQVISDLGGMSKLLFLRALLQKALAWDTPMTLSFELNNRGRPLGFKA